MQKPALSKGVNVGTIALWVFLHLIEKRKEYQPRINAENADLF
jgi:hypothetical protein